ncbi:unnamed protein product [Vitrella brassicaformis CCMP3155]|uniref:Uncharacterized protein n=3 Tax=Vitrella brassicaformis TaxID=1169539 RepID=A0A0G4G1C5_VITBC|nr:unnamed protein product [Vitrella brassicaformis CCMP3155]|eukprot:CEM21869.1 unnamed protein product [Vitrella brassicaformis CCMP3155]
MSGYYQQFNTNYPYDDGHGGPSSSNHQNHQHPNSHPQHPQQQPGGNHGGQPDPNTAPDGASRPPLPPGELVYLGEGLHAQAPKPEKHQSLMRANQAVQRPNSARPILGTGGTTGGSSAAGWPNSEPTTQREKSAAQAAAAEARQYTMKDARLAMQKRAKEKREQEIAEFRRKQEEENRKWREMEPLCRAKSDAVKGEVRDMWSSRPDPPPGPPAPPVPTNDQLLRAARQRERDRREAEMEQERRKREEDNRLWQAQERDRAAIRAANSAVVRGEVRDAWSSRHSPPPPAHPHVNMNAPPAPFLYQQPSPLRRNNQNGREPEPEDGQANGGYSVTYNNTDEDQLQAWLNANNLGAYSAEMLMELGFNLPVLLEIARALPADEIDEMLDEMLLQYYDIFERDFGTFREAIRLALLTGHPYEPPNQ